MSVRRCRMNWIFKGGEAVGITANAVESFGNKPQEDQEVNSKKVMRKVTVGMDEYQWGCPLCCVGDFLDSKTSCDLLQERFRKENASTYRRLCLTLAYLKPWNHRHQQLWLRSSSSSSILLKFHSLSLLSPTQCVSILPGWCSLGTWCKEMQACCSVLWVYFDYMRSFKVEFDEFFEEGILSEIEVVLGPCGELWYPSYSERHGWKYPGIGEFQLPVPKPPTKWKLLLGFCQLLFTKVVTVCAGTKIKFVEGC